MLQLQKLAVFAQTGFIFSQGLVLRMWKTRALTEITERVSVNDQKTYTDLSFNVVDITGKA